MPPTIIAAPCGAGVRAGREGAGAEEGPDGGDNTYEWGVSSRLIPCDKRGVRTIWTDGGGDKAWECCCGR